MEILLHKPELPLNDFKATLLDKSFTSSDGISYAKTVQVDFFDARGRKKETKEYGFVSSEEVYDCIEKGEPIHLGECYVQNFSLTDFRKRKILSSMEVVALTDFSARNSFFDCDHTVDFSY